MAPTTYVPVDRLLRHCAQWPTSHTLSDAVLARLDWTTRRIVTRGRLATRTDVVSCLALDAPSTGLELIELIARPHPLLRRVGADPRGWRDGVPVAGNRQVMMRLPSPVTRRLDALVDIAQLAGASTTRRQLVTSMILHRVPPRIAALIALFDDYIEATAGDAVIDGYPPAAVLSLRRCRPGRQPMPLGSVLAGD